MTDIVAIDLSGHQTNLTHNPAPDLDPAVARDGRIVFLSAPGGNPDLYVMDGDGRHVRRLTNSAVDNSGIAAADDLEFSQAAWSPRRDKIAFDGKYLAGPPDCEQHCASWHVMVIGADGSGLNPISDVGPVWSPSGREVAFQAQGWIYRVRADGRLKRRLAAGQDPTWSPDGRRLAFIDDHKLFTVSRNGEGKRRVSRRGESVVGAAWSPNGRTIACVAGTATGSSGGYPRNLRVEALRADGKRTHVLARESGSSLIWGSPVWTRDGKRILVAVEAH
jgi:Tol biopolymer transport system component